MADKLKYWVSWHNTKKNKKWSFGCIEDIVQYIIKIYEKYPGIHIDVGISAPNNNDIKWYVLWSYISLGKLAASRVRLFLQNIKKDHEKTVDSPVTIDTFAHDCPYGVLRPVSTEISNGADIQFNNDNLLQHVQQELSKPNIYGVMVGRSFCYGNYSRQTEWQGIYYVGELISFTDVYLDLGCCLLTDLMTAAGQDYALKTSTGRIIFLRENDIVLECTNNLFRQIYPIQKHK